MALSGFPIYRIIWPPDLLLRQFLSVLSFAWLSDWRLFGRWMLHNSLRTMPIGAGAKGMGCIGYPDHPVWEVTSRCNLTCRHCHVSAGADLSGELDTEGAKSLIRQLRRVPEFRVLVYSGGEPFMRADLMELLAYSKAQGFINVIATNATLINDSAAAELKKRNVAAVAVSLDSCHEHIHNEIRQDEFAFSKALEGIAFLKKHGLPVQVNITAMEHNLGHLDKLLEVCAKLDAVIVLLYQLVPVGRGAGMEKASLGPSGNRRLIEFIREKQKNFPGIIEPVAGPQLWPFLLKSKGIESPASAGLFKYVFHGCSAGRGFVYIKSDGEVWPCPFIELSAGNIRESRFKDIWEKAPIFKDLRARETLLKGKCGACAFKGLCGGCRGRAQALSGDIMAEDPSCFLY